MKMGWKNKEKNQRFFYPSIFSKSRKGLSEVVSTVILIGIAVAVGAVVWALVSNLVGEKLEEGEACFGVLDQVKLNNDYTCYDSSLNRMQFSISRGDIEIDEILISISYEGTSKSATLTNSSVNLVDVKNYPNGNDGVRIPDKNSGATYFFNNIPSLPDTIAIAPIVEGQQCGSADTLKEIDDCRALAS